MPRIIAIVAVLIMMFSMPLNSIAAQQDPPATEDSTIPRGSRLDPGHGLDTYEEIEQFTHNVVRHLDIVWSNWMMSGGLYKEPFVYIAILYPNQMAWTECGDEWVSGMVQNAYYCPANDTIYLPLDFLANHIWTYDVGPVPGDFAMATTIAHEFGHHIMWDMALQAEAMGYNVELPSSVKNMELFADCLAGAWTYGVYLDNYLDVGDLEEAIEGMYASGDYQYDNPDHHGTPAERANAWALGLYGSTTPGYHNQYGQPANCITAYWR